MCDTTSRKGDIFYNNQMFDYHTVICGFFGFLDQICDRF